MNFVLSWPVRIAVLLLIIFAVVVDGAAYIYRAQNHIPLSGPFPAACHGTRPCRPSLLGVPVYVHYGLDLSGGTLLELQMTDLPKHANLAQLQAATIQVLSRRVNALGVSQPVIAPDGSDRILVELAGVTPAQAEPILGQTGSLQFFNWVADSKAPGGPGVSPGYRPVPSTPPLTGADLASAQAAPTPQGVGYVVNVTFNAQGQQLFGQMTTKAYNACPTSQCPQRFVGAFLDLTAHDLANWDTLEPSLVAANGKMISNDFIINGPILSGQAQITGNFNAASASRLALLLESGALPVNLSVLESNYVGASLGAQSVRKSLLAGALGLLVVILFMILYYRVPGLLASLALMLYAAIVLAIFKVLPVTLTLAGLAGFILSVGMAVDANVLIFERLKEELRAGRTVGAAVEAGVARAWPAIRDSNTSTAITCLILISAAGSFAGGLVAGFAVTLLVGVAISMLSAIVITHNLLHWALRIRALQHPRPLGVTGKPAPGHKAWT